jgi:hypothetical protein
MVGCGSDDRSSDRVGATLKGLRYRDVEGGDDCPHDHGLGLICRLLCFVYGFGVMCGACCEAECTMLAGVGRVDPRCDRLEGVLGGLFRESVEAPFLQLRQL